MTTVIHTRSRNKFGAKPQLIDGIRFASIVEANRYQALRLLERAGAIRDLKPHPFWALVVKGIEIGKFTADSSYIDLTPGRRPELVVEDVKSRPTSQGEAYRLRVKLWKALYPGITFREVTK